MHKYTCSSYQATYYGTISLHFIVRCREHSGVITRVEALRGVSSSIRDHINDTGHIASFDNFCIIDKANNELDLLIYESRYTEGLPYA